MPIRSLNNFMHRPHAWLLETVVETPIRKLCSMVFASKKPKVEELLTASQRPRSQVLMTSRDPRLILNTYRFLEAISNQNNNTYVLWSRHGESEVNALKRVGGSSPLADLDLTEEGKEQAKKLGEALAPFKDQIRTTYTSPLKRAYQTAMIALTAMKYSGKQPQVDGRIKEKFFGEAIDGHSEENYKQFTAKEKAETQEMNFSQKWRYTVVKDAESFEKVYARVRTFMLEAASKHPGEIILAFGHKVSSIKVPAMGVLAENGIEVDYRDPPFNDPKNGATAVFQVDVSCQKIHLVAIDGFSFSFLAPQQI